MFFQRVDEGRGWNKNEQMMLVLSFAANANPVWGD